MSEILIERPRTMLKDLTAIALFVVAVGFAVIPLLVFYAVFVFKSVHGNEAPHSFWETYLIGMVLLVPLLIIFLWFIEISQYRRMSWYPYFFSPDKHFFLRVKQTSLEDTSKLLEAQQWNITTRSSDKICAKYKVIGRTLDKGRDLVGASDSWRSTALEIRLFSSPEGSLAYICIRYVGFARKNGFQTSCKSLADSFLLIDELFPNAEIFNQKWQKIDRRWSVVDPAPLTNSPEIKFVN